MHDLEHLRSWIGKTEEATDLIEPARVAELAATLDCDDALVPRSGDALPLAWHWAFFRPAVRESQLGPDGHPRRGGFLPPIELPRRMWAGGRLDSARTLTIGNPAVRRSTILDVTAKEGRAGALVFVTVEHQVFGADGALARREEQDIVYREASSPQAAAKAPPTRDSPTPHATWSQRIEPDPVLLFRYSAATFNGHRIHYDRSYVTEVEGYPGLVVHGPLIATLLLELLRRERPEVEPARFAFRAQRPLFDTAPFSVNGHRADDGTFALWALDPTGAVAMEATAG